MQRETASLVLHGFDSSNSLIAVFGNYTVIVPVTMVYIQRRAIGLRWTYQLKKDRY